MNRLKTLVYAAVPVLALGSAAVLAARRTPDGASSAPRAIPASAPAVPARVIADGRVVTYPGAEVVVGTDFAGTITRLVVDEKAKVARGQLLAELNADTERAALAATRARIAEADADIKLAESERTRAEQLLKGRVGTPQAVDKATRDLDAARARRTSLVAEAGRLEAQIAKARITSPLAGVVLLRHAHPGETVDRGARLLTIADLSRMRVEAEVDEADTSRVVLGAPVVLRGEGEPDRTARGTVEEIPDSVGPRRLKPQDPGRPSDTRVLLVKIALEDPAAFKLGRRVEVEIGGR